MLGSEIKVKAYRRRNLIFSILIGVLLMLSVFNGMNCYEINSLRENNIVLEKALAENFEALKVEYYADFNKFFGILTVHEQAIQGLMERLSEESDGTSM